MREGLGLVGQQHILVGEQARQVENHLVDRRMRGLVPRVHDSRVGKPTEVDPCDTARLHGTHLHHAGHIKHGHRLREEGARAEPHHRRHLAGVVKEFAGHDARKHDTRTPDLISQTYGQVIWFV